MQKRFFRIAVIAASLPLIACGCQSAPKSSSEGEIHHAEGGTEQEVQEIVESQGSETGIDRDMGTIDCLVGTEENGIRIEAPAPYIPEHVYHMVLGVNDALNEELLKSLLESDSGEIRDLSEEAKKEGEKIEKENEESDEPGIFSVFGDGSVLVLADANKEAGFTNGTAGYYKDKKLEEKCGSIYKSGTETKLDSEEDETAEESGEFSVKEAETMLLDKLSKIDVKEIMIYETVRYQSSDFSFYEIKFTPSYDGMGGVHEVGDVSLENMYQFGAAWVCKDGVATLSLDACLGNVKQKEECEKLLSWEQVEKIIEVNLKNGKIHGSSQIIMEKVELLYYPKFDEGKNEVELIPVWQIYVPMSVWIEDDKMVEIMSTDDAAWNICINAVSGEIVKNE